MKTQLKSLILACLALFMVTGCNSDKFTITANLKNLENQEVYLCADSQNGEYLFLDTAKVENGKFKFSGKMDYNDFRTITFQDMAGEIRLYMDNSNIKINGDFAKLDSLEVEGSPAMDYYKSFNADEDRMRLFIKDRVTAFNNAQSANDTVTMKKISDEVQQMRRDYSAELLGKINEHPDDLLSFIVVSNWLGYINPDDFADYYRKVPDRVKQDFRLGSFNTYVQENVIRLARGAEVPHISLENLLSEGDSITTENTVKGQTSAFYVTVNQLENNETIYPALKKAKEKGVDVVIVLLYVNNDQPTKIAEYAKENGLEGFKIAKGGAEFAQQMAAYSPRVFFIDKDGKFIGTALNAEQVEEIVGKL